MRGILSDGGKVEKLCGSTENQYNDMKTFPIITLRPRTLGGHFLPENGLFIVNIGIQYPVTRGAWHISFPLKDKEYANKIYPMVFIAFIFLENSLILCTLYTRICPVTVGIT